MIQFLNRYALIAALFVLFACKKEEDSINQTTTPQQIPPSGKYTYLLEESSSELDVWTMPCTQKALSSDLAPEETHAGIKICAAKHEYEPFQLILGQSNQSVTISIDDFSTLGADAKVEIHKVGFESGYAELLIPIDNGGTIQLSSSQCSPVWFTVYVPHTAVAGEHTAMVTIKSSSHTIEIPVVLKVFDFELPEEIHFYSQFNLTLGSEQNHTQLYQHRLTPKSPAWPSGFRYEITWPSPYNSFFDEPDENPAYSLKHLAAKYLKGEEWLGSGYPTGMAFQFVDNKTPRPISFAGVNRGASHYGTDEYNVAWKKYLAALEQYLVNHHYSDKVYYYVMNEPQNSDDYDLAAFLSKLTKEAAPKLKLAISEEPKPEIAENKKYGGCTYDIWIASMQHFKQDYANSRMAKGEQVWLYSLPQDPEPFFNPTKVSNQGIHQRIIPWVSWACRTRGWAYFDGNSFYRNGRPDIRMELLREGFEDYEYLYLANNNQYPLVNQSCPIDESVKSVASNLTSWIKDADALMDLKWKLGEYIESNGTSEIPKIEIDVKRPRGEYYINFQDTKGHPLADPLFVDGHTYLKIGWEEYNTSNYYGWSGSALGNDSRTKTGYYDVDGFSEIEKSYLYDDYGHINTFTFDIENGTYMVTVGVGRPNKTNADATNVTVEGVSFYNEVKNISSSESETKQLTITDGNLTLTMGTILNNSGQYTFLSYLKIVPVN